MSAVDGPARFAGRADDYDRYRPRYPREAIDAILNGLAEPLVADIGAGTGIGSVALCEAGARVIAIEPNPEMRSVLARQPGLDVREGRGERTGLPPESVDVVTMFQAFHWCEGEPALAEFARILRPGGRVAIVYPDPDRDDPASSEWARLTARHGETAMLTARPRGSGTTRLFLESPRFENARVRTFGASQTLDRDGIAGRIRGLSHVPLQGAGRDAALADGDGFFARFAVDDRVTLRYRVAVALAERPR